MGRGMSVSVRMRFALLAAFAAAVVALTASAGTATGASAAAAGLVPKVGTGGPQTGPFTPWEGPSGDEFFGGAEVEGSVY